MMKRTGTCVSLLVMAVGVPTGVVGMERLDDQEMSDVQGQRGVTLELSAQANVGTFSYFDDGNGIHLDNVSVGSASTPGEGDFQSYAVDLENDGSMNIDFDIEDQRVAVEGVRFDDSNGKSMGSFWMDRNMEGNFRITPGGALSADGYTFDTNFTMTDGRFGFATNGQQIFMDDVSMTVNSVGQTLDVQDNKIIYSAPVDGNLNIGAIRFAEQAQLFRGDASSLASFGRIEFDFDFETDLEIQAGGRFDEEGFRIDSDTQLNTASFLYKTNGNSLALNNMSGQSTVTDLRIDVAPDFTSEGRQGLGFTLSGSDAKASGNLSIGSVELGGTGSIGSVNLEWLFKDQTVNGETFSNQMFLMAGGNAVAGPEGMRIANEWSLADAQLGYTTNGNKVIFDGIQSVGRGDVTLDVTSEETLNGTQFFGGLRVGFEDFSGEFHMDGIRLGDESAELQGGAELLGIPRSFEFGQLDGHFTMAPGGPDGEGITINSDIVIQDGQIGTLTEDSGQGIWADDLDFESHIRDMTLEVTEEGLALVQAEAWSTMDIGNLRVGDADNGASFGRIVWQRYGENNQFVISSSESDTGKEGLKVALTQIFKEASGGRQNQFIWHTGRDTDGNGSSDNNTGVQLALNNIHTSDGNGSGSNDFGIQTDLNVAVEEVNGSSSQLGFSVNTRTRFKELNIGSVDLVHSGNDNAATLLHGVSIQNMDMESNLTATPIE